ncbi:probable CCR4-associated factor 1 homolog 6 [Phragmites australis]|uniref:probable CCR4-associated factor 1 homolog 6 n=1 Tax=Phragmites australis TaxID=29695 RepID=UPI002D797F66|nr:probable CCR4-associated factor 1 homolog 6 [Phragmites australis]
MVRPPQAPVLQWPHRAAASTAGEGKGAKKRKAKIVDVWAHNMEAELELIRSVVPDYPIVAVTTSPDVAVGRAPVPDPESSYDTFLLYIQSIRFAEVSLAFTNPRGELALRRFWRFHLGDFGAGHLRFFEEMGVEVPARRANARRFGAALMAFETLVNPRVAWVTYDGAADLAYLISFIGAGLPSQSCMFLPVCRTFFPAMYDLKVLAMHDELEGVPANDSSNALLEAPAPDAIMAGSNALAGCLGDPTSAVRLERYRGVLFGFDDDHSAPWRATERWTG